eukprot:3331567-Pyramimonas_sp.AAC.1
MPPTLDRGRPRERAKKTPRARPPVAVALRAPPSPPPPFPLSALLPFLSLCPSPSFPLLPQGFAPWHARQITHTCPENNQSMSERVANAASKAKISATNADVAPLTWKPACPNIAYVHDSPWRCTQYKTQAHPADPSRYRRPPSLYSRMLHPLRNASRKLSLSTFSQRHAVFIA